MSPVKNRAKRSRLPVQSINAHPRQSSLLDYIDVLPPQCDRCRNNGQLPGNFLVAILCKPCLLQVLVDMGVVTKINHNKRLVCPDCRTPVTFPRQVIFTNGRIKHSGRCETHGWLEWWLSEPRTVA